MVKQKENNNYIKDLKDLKDLNIAVVTPDLSSYGGGTRCAISCINALKEKGIISDTYQHFFKRFALYNGFLKNIQMLFHQNYDYVFDFTNTLSYNKRNYFNYIHFPEYIVAERGKYNKGLWRFYYWPKKILNPKSRKIVQDSNINFACNSKFTAKRVYETVGRKIDVIYPPCDIDKFKNNNKKRRQVMSIGGFTNEKKQLLQVEISQAFPKINFEICGSATRNPKYLDKVINLSKDLDNVFLNPNVAFNVLKDKLTRSLIFLHTSVGEPFGISTVEAISAGCIPIVHNSGGQMEIVPYEELRFNTKEEAIDRITDVLNMTPQQLCNYRIKLQKHIKQFDSKIFKDKMLKLLN